MRDAAVHEKREGAPVKIIYNSKVIEVDTEVGQVRFEYGTTVEGDLILGADGVYVSLSPHLKATLAVG